MKRNTHWEAEARRPPPGRTRAQHVGAAVAGMQGQNESGAVGIKSALMENGECYASVSSHPVHTVSSSRGGMTSGALTCSPTPFGDSILTPPSSSFWFDQHVMEAMDELEGKTNCKQSPNIPQPEHSSSDMTSEGTKVRSEDLPLQANPPSFSPAADNLLLSKWNLPQKVLTQYSTLGIEAMFPWQAQCLSLPGVLNRRCSLVYSAPTSAGKTLVAELLVVKCIFETRKKALFVLPYVSVTHEKETYFKQLLEPVGVKVGGFHGGRSPSGGLTTVDLALCTIEKANSIVNHLLEEGKLDTVGAIVVDELHMIGDTNRGYLLELLLTKVLYWCRRVENGPLLEKNTTKSNSERNLCPCSVQIIGMSATLPNLSMVAQWLGAQLFATDFRPVPLQEMVKIGQALYGGDTTGGCLQKVRDLAGEPLGQEEEDIAALCWETVKENHCVLIFCPTKKRCENLAVLLAQQIPHFRVQDPAAPQRSTPDLIAVCEQLRRTQVGLDPILEATLPHGVAFHHAGLTFDEREIVEGAFRRGKVQVLVATSTLSSGVNLPARRVIIRSPIFHGQLLNMQVYKQMVGRAGRKGVDSLGESILLCKPSEKSKAVKLLTGSLCPIQSCLGQSGVRSGGVKAGRGKQVVPSAMKRALLEVVADGAATSYADLGAYTSSTLLLKEMSCSDEQLAHFHKETTNGVLSFLLENEFIRQRENETNEREPEADQFTLNTLFYATQLGVATVASSLSPDEALVVFSELQKARKAFVLQNELHIIYLVTPIHIHEQWPNIDWYLYLRIWESLPQDMKHAAQVIGVSESFLVRATSGRVPTYTVSQQQTLMIHKRFFTALALQDLVQEVPVSSVATRYGASKGLIQSLQSSAGMYAGMVTVFCQKLGWSNLELLFSQFQSRLTFGVERELTDLVRVSLLNGQRARVLYNAGYHSLASLATANPVTIEATLRNSVPFKSYKLGGDGGASTHGGLSVNWCPRLRRGLQEGEAALKIVEEAQQLLSEDLNLPLSTWKNKHGCLSIATEKAEQPKLFPLNVAPSTDPLIRPCDKPTGPPEPQQPLCGTILGVSSVEPPSSSSKGRISEEIVVKTEDEVTRSECCGSNTIRIPRKSPRSSSHDGGVLKKSKFSPPAVAKKKDGKVEKSSMQVMHCTKTAASAISLKSPPLLAAHLSSTLAHKSSTPITGEGTRPDQEQLAELKLTASSNKRGPSDPHLLISPITVTPSTATVLGKQSAKSAQTEGSITRSTELSPFGMDFSLGLSARALAVIDTACMEAESSGVDGPPCKALQSASSISVIADSPLCCAPRNVSQMDISVGGRMSDFNESSFLNAIPPTPPHLVNHSTASEYNKIPSDCDPCQGPSDHVSVVPNSPMAVNSAASFHELSSLCATQDDESGLTIIDVTANSQLFRTFIQECTEQKSLSFSVATQSVCGQDGMGLQYTAPTVPPQHGLPIPLTNLEMVGVAVCWGGRDVYYISLCDAAAGSTGSEEVSADLSIEERVHSLSKIFTDGQRTIAFDVKRHVKDLAACGCFPLRSQLLDPKVADWMLDPDAKEKTLARTVMLYLPSQPLLVQAGIGGELPLTTLATHGPTPKLQAASESVLALMLMQQLESLLQTEDMFDAFIKVEMPVQISLAKMELVGIGFLEESCKAIQSVIQSRLFEIEKECYNLANHPFSLSSPEDVAHVLFIELHLPCGTDLDERRPLRGRGRGGGRGRGRKRLQHLSTAKDVLEKITHLHPLPSLILEWRRITNTISKVVHPLSKEAVWHSELGAHRMHYTCLFHTATGRVNVANPNLQNVPKTYRIGEDVGRSSEATSVPFGEEERVPKEEQDSSTSVCMRNVFVACKGRVLLAADYSQLELRVLAHLSGDKRLKEILNRDGDVFKLIACQWLNKSVDQITKSERQQAKSICYGMVYGIGSKALAEQLKVTEEDAAKFMDGFLSQFPTVKTYVEKTVEFCRNSGYITTYSGRRRRLPAIHSTNPAARCQAERQAVNSSIQGSAADIVKMAMIAIDKHLSASQVGLHVGVFSTNACSGLKHTLYDSQGLMVLQVHDELVFEVNERSILGMARLVQHQMEGATELSVRLPVKLHCGQTWGSLTELNL